MILWLFSKVLDKRQIALPLIEHFTNKIRSGLDQSDLVFCDTATLGMVRARHKIHYQLIAKDCLTDLSATLSAE